MTNRNKTPYSSKKGGEQYQNHSEPQPSNALEFTKKKDELNNYYKL